MSKYTTEVRFICETAAGFDASQGYAKVDEIIGLAVPHIFDFEFPIFDEEHRPELCKKILKHYYTREIGAETVGLWKLWLNTRMNEIMPYYNEMYKTAAIEYDPTHNINSTTSRNIRGDKWKDTDYLHKDKSKDTVITGDSTKVELDALDENTYKYSDTPQGMLQGVESGAYLTEASYTSIDKFDTTTTRKDAQVDTDRSGEREGWNKDKSTNIDTFTETVTGKVGADSFSKMIMEYRKAVLNVDMMIVDELKDLFLNLW